MARGAASGGSSDGRFGLSRRSLLKRAGAVAAAGAVIGPAAAAFGREATGDLLVQGPGPVDVTLNVNGKSRKVSVEPRETLLDVLRLRLDLTAGKRPCDRGACGACTILFDGLAVNACTVLAVDGDGHAVRTAEDVAKAGEGLALQFVAKDAMQCGFCTPGMLVSCAAALGRHGGGITKDQARAATAGNLCRCGTYPHVLEAVLAAVPSR